MGRWLALGVSGRRGNAGIGRRVDCPVRPPIAYPGRAGPAGLRFGRLANGRVRRRGRGAGIRVAGWAGDLANWQQGPTGRQSGLGTALYRLWHGCADLAARDARIGPGQCAAAAAGRLGQRYRRLSRRPDLWRTQAGSRDFPRQNPVRCCRRPACRVPGGGWRRVLDGTSCRSFGVGSSGGRPQPGGPGRRFAGKLRQAPLWREGFRLADPRPWRAV